MYSRFDHHAFPSGSNADPFDRHLHEVFDELDVLLAVFWEGVVGSDLFYRRLPARQSDIFDFNFGQKVEIG